MLMLFLLLFIMIPTFVADRQKSSPLYTYIYIVPATRNKHRKKKKDSSTPHDFRLSLPLPLSLSVTAALPGAISIKIYYLNCLGIKKKRLCSTIMR